MKNSQICPPLTKIPKTFTNYEKEKIADEQQSKEIVLGILVCSVSVHGTEQSQKYHIILSNGKMLTP